MPDQPNILVILTDDHGQWCSGAYGNSEVRTPTLDHLARTGVRMANAFCITPVCSPSRATFWTGLTPSQHGIHDYLGFGDPEIVNRDWMAGRTTLARYLKNAGYVTGFSGKWHCGRPHVPQDGFDDWFSIRGTGPHRHEAIYYDGDRELKIAGYKTSVITDRAIQFLRQRDKDRPFFSFLGPVATHSPWTDHPPRLVEQYRPACFRDIPDDVAHPFGKMAGESSKLMRDDREQRAQYYAAVSEIDEQVSRLADELDAQGALDQTLIVYTADHGLNVGHHGLWGKGNATRPLNMLEESIRVPLIFSQHAALHRGIARGEFVDHADLFLTLLAFAGVEPPADVHYPGRSYAPLLAGGRIDDWKQIQIGEYGNLRMARNHTHKLIRRYPNGPSELFDLGKDPRETTNLIADPDLQPMVRALDAAIERHFAPFADSPQSGLRVAELPRHNPVEAWRGEP